jgi:hypothetical protein
VEPHAASDPLKTIIQIVIAAVIVIACARGGESAWRYYEFKDAVEQEARFGNAKTTSQLHHRVVELAKENNVELAYEDVVVEARESRSVVTVSYVEPIALVPALYTRNQEFNFEVSVQVVRPLIVDEKK